MPLLVWQSVVWWLALAGAFQGAIGPAPLLPLAIVLPLLIGLPILLNSNTIGQLLDAMPPSWLVGLQVYRVFGSVFLTGWLAGNLPAIPAVPAGAGDTLVGLLALPVALLLASPTRGARGVNVQPTVGRTAPPPSRSAAARPRARPAHGRFRRK